VLLCQGWIGKLHRMAFPSLQTTSQKRRISVLPINNIAETTEKYSVVRNGVSPNAWESE
jgi:hypothetical protein